jgi:hypothetical protein
MERKLKPSAKETFFTPKSDSTPELFAGSPHSQSNERKGEELLQRGKAVAQRVFESAVEEAGQQGLRQRPSVRRFLNFAVVKSER